MTRPTLRMAAVMTILTVALLGSSAVSVFAVGGGTQIKVIVDLKAPANRSDRKAITALGGSVRQSFRLINAISATLPAGAVNVLEHNPNVQAVERDHTLEEVGRQLSITRERVRQIEAKALRKLKHPSRLRALKVLTTA